MLLSLFFFFFSSRRRHTRCYRDWSSDVCSSDLDSQVSRILKAEVRQVLDLEKGPLVSFQLMKLSASHHLLAFTAHMIVCDGWGFKVVLEEISALYSVYVEGREPSLAPANQMREYVS